MQGLHIERITRQQTFWEQNKEKAEYFLGHVSYQRSWVIGSPGTTSALLAQ